MKKKYCHQCRQEIKGPYVEVWSSAQPNFLIGYYHPECHREELKLSIGCLCVFISGVIMVSSLVTFFKWWMP